MIVNDIPGEECRIAILRDGHLEELYSERISQATTVGNIYKGRVSKVEPAIQAAFIEFGDTFRTRQSGFLHITDLHPRYFPRDFKNGSHGSRTERVGKKIPRRQRPPIQDALKRGDEVLVQVLKEGLGTKGPTLTSYLSIPGRLLVMMPEMDRVGVSRKLENDEQRREMRKVLDSLELPKGFGFILRTAGIGRPKTELKRDVAYLTRLWKVMDKRINHVAAPCELYTESDVLIRTVRDVLRPSISAVVVDSESAWSRASEFLRVVAPRSAPKVLRYRDRAPIFHAFDIERQIELIHNREVPLPSGGAIIIEQTEAMVTIDVNSGRSRSARDSETNAYHTNCEAVDEICRQLRLRDLGGIVVCDLIDMRINRNRRAMEDRVRENLKRDRAKTTITRISEFGLLELTRQRMRPSLRRAHFTACPHCQGRGEIKIPESVASDALRQIGFFLYHDRVRRVELVCSPRVATVMLSTKRRALVRLEDETGKRIDVRVSDAFNIDHVEYYAYDDRNADIDIEKLPPIPAPTVKQLEKAAEAFAKQEGAAESTKDESAEAEPSAGKKKKRRRRRRKSAAAAEGSATEGAATGDDGQVVDKEEGEGDESVSAQPSATDRQTGDGEPTRRSRRRRRGRRRKGDETVPQTAAPEATSDNQHGGKEGEYADSDDSSCEEQTLRIHQLARQLDVPAREIVQKCQEEPSIEVKSHMSCVSADQAEVIRNWFENDSARSDDAGAADKKKKSSRRKKRRKPTESDAQSKTSSAESQPDARLKENSSTTRRRTRKKSRKKSDNGGESEAETAQPSSTSAQVESSQPASDSSGSDGKTGESRSARRRALYRNRRKPSPTALEHAEQTEQ